nr:phage tail protein [Aminobacter aminovorans]
MGAFGGWGDTSGVSITAEAPSQRLVCTLVLAFCETDLGGPVRLLQLRANDTLVYSAIEPKRSLGSPMAFYGGDQTSVDPTISAAIGADASYWPGLAYVVLKDFDIKPYGSVPGDIEWKAVLGTSVTDQTAQETESTLTGAAFTGQFQSASAVDHTLGVAYQIVWADADTFSIVTTDIESGTEIRRVALAGTGFDYFESLTALLGSGFVVGQAITSGGLNGLVMVDTRTGAVVKLDCQSVGATKIEPGIISSVMLKSGAATQYAIACFAYFISGGTVSGNDGMIALADVTNGTLSWIAGPAVAPIRSGTWQELQSWTWASVANGVATAFFCERNETAIWRCTVSETGVSGLVSVTSAAASYPAGLAYDSLNNAVVYMRDDETLVSFDLDTKTNRYSLDMTGQSGFFNAENFETQDALRPGYVRMIDGSGMSRLLDMGTGQATAIYDSAWPEFFAYNQYKAWGVQPGSTPGTSLIIRFGDSTPNAVDAVDILTALATYNGDYDASDLTFTGFPGNEAIGFPIYEDTTIDEAMGEVCFTLGARKTHDDGKIHFKIPARDGAFAVDRVLTHDDIVERNGQSIVQTIRDRDAAIERGVLRFCDPDKSYDENEVEFVRPNGVYDVIASNRKEEFSTSLVMTMPQAAKQINRLVYESDAGSREYQFGVMPSQFAVNPASNVQFGYGPSDEITVVGEVVQSDLRDDFSQDFVLVEALQAVETTFAGTGLVTVPIQDVSFNVEFVILDTALLTYADDTATGLRGYGILIGAGANPIGPSAAWKSADGDTFTQFGSVSNIAPVAGTITALDRNRDDGFATDFAGSLTVLITSGDPADIDSASEEERYQNFNLAAIGQQGRWVLVSFGGVEATGNSVVLSDLIWGIKGTEVYLSQLVAGDRFIRLQPSEVLRFVNDAALLNDPVYYKGGYSGLLVGQMMTQIDVANGEAEKPYASVDLAYSDAGSTRTITWEFRERLDPMRALYGETPGYSESVLEFEVDVLNGSTVLTTLAVTDNEADYDTTTHSGATSARIYQMGRAGTLRGHAASLTF